MEPTNTNRLFQNEPVNDNIQPAINEIVQVKVVPKPPETDGFVAINSVPEVAAVQPVTEPVQEVNNLTAPEAAIEQPRTALLARRVPIDMGLPGESSPSRLTLILKQTKWHKVRAHTTKIAAIGLILLITLGGLIFSQTVFKVHKVFRGSDVASADTIKKPDNQLKGTSTGRVNLLLLGRNGVGKNPDVTNSIIFVSYDIINNKATVFSLPSNLWVNTSSSGVMKLSEVYERGEFNYDGNNSPGSTDTNAIAAGYSLLDSTVSSMLGQPVDYNVLVNESALEQIVDSVGGISVNVPSDLVDPTIAWENGNNPTIVKAGQQTLNGKEAYLYVSSLETTSNASRESRQRAVLMALENKMVTAGTYSNPLQIASLFNTFSNNVVTDLSVNNAYQLYKVISASNNNITNYDLTTAPNQQFTTGNVNGQSVMIPTAGIFNYSGLQQFISSQLIDPFIAEENAKILILNGTDIAGIATNLGNQLKGLGYNVIGESNAPTPDWTHTTLFNVTKSNQHTQSDLENRLGVYTSSNPPNSTIPTLGADFVIILGSDETNSTQNQAN